MIKDEMLKAFERFKEIEAQANPYKSNIRIDFNMRVNRYGTHYVYLFVEDVEKNVHGIVSIKGINGLPLANEIETLEDIEKFLGELKNE